MAKGGKRAGAGNKEGSVRPKITHYWTQEDIEDYFIWLKQNYKTSPQLAKFVGEQIMGKAVQPLSNDEGRPLIIQFDNAFTQTPERDS